MTAPPAQSQHLHAPALQACVQEAVAEGAGLARRWVIGLLAELKVQESAARNYREKTAVSEAIKAMATHQAGVEAGFVAQWAQAIQEALKGHAPGGALRKSLSQVRFDELELMDDDQVQATVETARVLQAVQVSSDLALGELTARLSRAQGLGAVRVDHNPFRPDVVIQALTRALESQIDSVAVRSQWLQHGSKALAAELDLLYRHLGRLLDEKGVRPADYARVVGVPTASAGTAAGSAGARGGSGGRSPSPSQGGGRADPLPSHAEANQGFYANQVEPVRGVAHSAPGARQPQSRPMDFQPSSLFTLSHLHQLLLSASPELEPATGTHAGGVPRQRRGTTAPVANAPRPQEAAVVASEALPDVYLGPDRRRRPRGTPTGAGGREAAEAAEAADSTGADAAQPNPLANLAEEVVGMMLDGIASDERLLPPVRAELRRLRPLLLRVAQETPRFFADRNNPARCLLDEVTQQGLAFSSEDSSGFDVFMVALRQVVQGLLQADSPAVELLERAMHALLATGSAVGGGADGLLAQERAVAALLKAEQRFLLADKVAAEIRARKEYRRAPAVLQGFLTGPWSQVVASARLDPAAGSSRTGQLPADVRYMDLISDLTWSCLPEVAGRNRSRLVRVIPLLLRNLREGLQTIGYPQERSCDFFNQLMQLQEAALKAVPVDVPADAGVQAPGPAAQVEAILRERSAAKSAAPVEPWVSPQESQDTGFMDMPDDDPPPSDFADTQPMSDANWDISVPEEPAPAPDLVLGSWIEMRQATGDWQRARLVWASPHGTMYLFSVNGKPSVSMTRRNFQSLVQRQRARCVAVQSMVDDALDNVMDAAVRNSVARTDPTRRVD